MTDTVCHRCGAAAPADVGQRVLAGWSTGADRDRPTLICPTCTRRHIRDIEAKLDDPYWS